LLSDSYLFLRDRYTKQRQGRGLVDLDRHDTADEARITFKNDDVIGHGPAGELHWSRSGALLVGRLARSLDQDRKGLPDELLVVRQAGSVLQGQQVVVPPLLDLIGHIIGVQVVPLGTGARTVLEDEAVLEAGVPDQVAASLEGLLGLTAEPDN